MSNKPYLLALNRIAQIGPRTIAKLLKRWPDLAELFKTNAAELINLGLSPKIAEAIKAFDFKLVEQDLKWQETTNHHLLTWEDSNYPVLLKEIYASPPVLYAAGNLDCLKQACLAIVGTRKPSVAGSEIAFRFAHDLACHQLTIVSGLAIGIDAKAHEGCLAANGKTIAVMGTGIDKIYPYVHYKLAEKIKEKGLLISELPLNSPPAAGHFPRRNRIISGLSLATLVVEAAIKSGSLITARLALEQNREVMAIPGSIHNPQVKGCHYLLQQGAKLVSSSADVLEELNITSSLLPSECNDSTSSDAKEKLIKYLGYDITTLEQIIQHSGLSVEEAACDLAELEIRGIVKAVPGGYMRCL